MPFRLRKLEFDSLWPDQGGSDEALTRTDFATRVKSGELLDETDATDDYDRVH